MKIIPLSKGMFTLVDDEDYDELIKFKWCVRKGKKENTYYARRGITIKGKKFSICMHRQIMGYPVGLLIDHKDRNGLNNQKYNLRKCTKSQNGANRKSKREFMGVFSVRNKFRAIIRKDSKNIHLGYFNDKKEAAHAYNMAAIKYHGEFANLNKL